MNATPGAARRGILLFAHGARDPRWAAPFEAVAARMRELEPGCEVALAFLEFMSPGIEAAGDTLAARGCAEVRVVPVFLGAGGHVRKDVPPLVARLAERHPAVRWQLRPSVGEAQAVVDAMARTALAGDADNPADPPQAGAAATPHR